MLCWQTVRPCTLYNIHIHICTLYNVTYKVNIIKCKMYIVDCSIYIIQYTHRILCTYIRNIVYCIIYIIQSTSYTVYCKLYNYLHCTVLTVCCTSYSNHYMYTYYSISHIDGNDYHKIHMTLLYEIKYLRCTLYSVRRTMYVVHYSSYIIFTCVWLF